MSIDPVAAAVAAVVAAQVMEMPAYAQRAMRLGVRQDVFSEAGAILRAPVRGRRLAGWAGHAALAVAIVLLYAAFFAGGVHAVLGGIVVGAWVDLHPDMPHDVAAPGVFYRHYGRRDVLTFLGGHLLFGALSGTLYALLHDGLEPAAAF